MLRITFNNDLLGPYETMSAIGVNDVVQNVKRDKESHGIVFAIILNLSFIKDGRQYLKQAFENYGGIDASVSVFMELYNPNLYKWEPYFNGQVDFNLRDLEEDRITVNIVEGLNFQSVIINGKDTDINLETLEANNGEPLPPLLTIAALPLHSKTIKRNSVKLNIDDDSVALEAISIGNILVDTNTIYGLNSLDGGTLDEIEDFFSYPTQFIPNKINLATTDPSVTPESLSRYIYKVKEAGHYTINVHATTLLKMSQFVNIDFSWQLRFKSSLGGALLTFGTQSLVDVNTLSSSADTSYEIDLAVGDTIYLYFVASVTTPTNTDIEIWRGATAPSLNLVANTTFPESTCKAILIYEAIQKCIQVLTGRTDCFKSDLLGRTDIGYDEDGDGSLLALTNGRLIRGVLDFDITRSTELSATLSYLLDFVNSVYCIGYGVEIIDGVEKFVVEQRGHFYTRIKSISLGRVGPIISKVNPEAYFSTIEFGYSTKLENNEVNSIDEFNTLRVYGLPIVNTKNVLKVSTPMKVSGYHIEKQRRLANSSEDSNLDEELFIICVIRNGGSFKSQSDEGYTTITNVFDSPSGYNYPISPARILQNWLPFIATALIKSLSKVVKFKSGTTNFLMTSQQDGEAAPLAENGDVDLTYVTPIYDPTVYVINDSALNRDQITLIKSNPRYYIDFEDRFGAVMGGWFNERGLEHNSDKGKGKFELIKAL